MVALGSTVRCEMEAQCTPYDSFYSLTLLTFTVASCLKVEMAGEPPRRLPNSSRKLALRGYKALETPREPREGTQVPPTRLFRDKYIIAERDRRVRC